jgi:hypothetical protein
MLFAAKEKKRKVGDKTALSAQQVADKVNKEHGTSVTRFTIRRYVKEGMIGESPKKCGPSSWLPDHGCIQSVIVCGRIMDEAAAPT